MQEGIGLHIALVRHPESLKNLMASFGGSDPSADQLTTEGIVQIERLGQQLRSLADRRGLNVGVIHSSPLHRARDSARLLAQQLSAPLREIGDLAGIHHGRLAGSRESSLKAVDPQLDMRLRLYRSGLLNGYDLDFPGEALTVFEQRVSNAFDEIVTAEGTLDVLVAHRSTITALLMHLTRSAHGYPRDFYGYVDLPPSSVTLVNRGSDGMIELIASTSAP